MESLQKIENIFVIDSGKVKYMSIRYFFNAFFIPICLINYVLSAQKLTYVWSQISMVCYHDAPFSRCVKILAYALSFYAQVVRQLCKAIRGQELTVLYHVRLHVIDFSQLPHYFLWLHHLRQMNGKGYTRNKLYIIITTIIQFNLSILTLNMLVHLTHPLNPTIASHAFIP